MKWLLVFFVFQVDSNGDLEEPVFASKLYDSEGECNVMGDNLRDIVKLPEDWKTLSSCVPQSAFEE